MKNPPIVILHGWGLSGERFEPLRKELSQLGYPIYAPDLPGFGKTRSPTHPLALADYANFLSEYIWSHKITEPVLVGHSFGGRIALKFNELYPGRTKALILTGVPGFTPIPKRRLALFILLAKLGRLVVCLPPLIFFRNQIRRWYYYFVGAREFFRAEGVMRETFKRIVQEDLVSSMEAVSIPTLLIWGELDIIVPVSIAEKMHRVIGGSKLEIIPDTDHGVPFKEPKRFVSHVKRLLESL